MPNPDFILLTIAGYPLTILEFTGTLFNLVYVLLMTRQNTLAWPVGILGAALFALTFYRTHLYADFLEQIYYLGACAYGWWWWRHPGVITPVPAARFSSRKQLVAVAVLTLISFGFALFSLRRLHIWSPHFFPHAAAFPELDAISTVMSFVAMGLAARKRIENWIYWILVNTIGVGIYYARNLKFISALSAVFLILSGVGLRRWLDRSRRWREGDEPLSSP